MEKTINCENCTREYTFEENPKFPRKYCDICSAMKKAEFEGTNGDAKPIGTGDPHFEHAKPEKPKDNGFHLTPENCRALALNAAAIISHEEISRETFWKRVKEFEKYIVNGE